MVVVIMMMMQPQPQQFFVSLSLCSQVHKKIIFECAPMLHFSQLIKLDKIRSVHGALEFMHPEHAPVLPET